MPLAAAADPSTSASASSGGSSYSFGGWATSQASVSLACTAGSSDCASTAYCIDSSNTCDPTASGIAYSGSFNISSDGTTYIRYASNNSTGAWGSLGSATVKIDSIFPAISISNDASGSWTRDDTISVGVGDNGSGIANTRWVARADSSCGAGQDSEIDSGTSGTSLEAADDSAYQGKYICFRATDSAGNRNYTVSSQINYLDTTSPTVSAGLDTDTNAQFTSSASANDSGSGVASCSWSASSGHGTVAFGSPNSPQTSISAAADGTYTITLTAVDKAGNMATGSFILVWDTAPPAITIGNPGNSTAQSKKVSAYSPDGVLSIAVTTGSVCDSSLSFNQSPMMTFSSESGNGKKVCFRSIDGAGNTAYALSEPVSGIVVARPTITLKGSSLVLIEAGSSYTDGGATALDNYDGDITSKIKTSNSVNASKIGQYTVTYDVTDSSGAAAEQVSRKVIVADTTKPVISLIGNATVSVKSHTAYSDEGATASDNYDGDITRRIATANPVNTSVGGTYKITYDVSDSSGNKAVQVTRAVAVFDDYLPAILVCIAILVVVGGVGAYLVYARKKHGL